MRLSLRCRECSGRRGNEDKKPKNLTTGRTKFLFNSPSHALDIGKCTSKKGIELERGRPGLLPGDVLIPLWYCGGLLVLGPYEGFAIGLKRKKRKKKKCQEWRSRRSANSLQHTLG